MTDAGMTGDYDSIIGMQKEEPLRRFTSGIPSGRFEPALGAATLSGVAVETDDATGLALRDRAGADRRQAGAGAAGILAGVGGGHSCQMGSDSRINTGSGKIALGLA